MATNPTPTFAGLSGGQYTAIAGLVSAYGQQQFQRAAAIQEQTSYLLRARETLALADVRADMDLQYAEIQAGRTLKKAEIESRNWQIQGNNLLKNMRSTNATLRARAAASGIAVGEGSTAAIAQQNVEATMRDLAVTDFNSLAARVLGFEDATALLQSTEMQNIVNLYSAGAQAEQFQQAGAAARGRTLLADVSLVKAGADFYKTFQRS